jgi:hypothetical protein
MVTFFIHCYDANLQGLGGICYKTSGTQVFHCNVPKHVEGTRVGVYEMLAILVGSVIIATVAICLVSCN